MTTKLYLRTKKLPNFLESFIAFMNSKNSYSRFITNMKEQSRCTITKLAYDCDSGGSNYARMIRWMDVINSHLIWANTPEGRDYWSLLNTQWKNHFCRIYQKHLLKAKKESEIRDVRRRVRTRVF